MRQTLNMFLCWTILVLGVLQSAWARHLTVGEIGFKAIPLSPGLHHIEATDGIAVLTTLVSRDRGLITCSKDGSESAIASIVGDRTSEFVVIGEQQIEDMWRRCQIAEKTNKVWKSKNNGHLSGHEPVSWRAAVLDTTHAPGEVPFPPEHTGDPEGPGSHILIVSDTLWCGNGNVASSYEDLGPSNETDSCCRTHDHCPYFISAFTTKYHYYNIKPWTISFCDCDLAFFRCLKQVSDEKSNEVGQLFFGALSVQCFRFQNGDYCQTYHWTHLWCTAHENGPMAVVHEFQYSWADSPTDSPLVGK